MAVDPEPLLIDVGNAYGPFGNDTGADVHGLYLRWRQAGRIRNRFLPKLLGEWEIEDCGWEDCDSALVAKQLAESPYQRLVQDDLIIALAFAQQLIDGKVEEEVKNRALKVIDRQGLDRVLALRDWTDRSARVRAL